MTTNPKAYFCNSCGNTLSVTSKPQPCACTGVGVDTWITEQDTLLDPHNRPTTVLSIERMTDGAPYLKTTRGNCLQGVLRRDGLLDRYWTLYDKASVSAQYCFDLSKPRDRASIEPHLKPDEYSDLIELADRLYGPAAND